MNILSNRLFLISTIGLILAMVIGLGRLNTGILTIFIYVMPIGVGWLFFNLIVTATVSNVWLKILIGWALLFVLVQVVADSFLYQYFPEFESRSIHLGASFFFGYSVITLFIFLGLLRRFGDRITQINQEEVLRKNSTRTLQEPDEQ